MANSNEYARTIAWEILEAVDEAASMQAGFEEELMNLTEAVEKSETVRELVAIAREALPHVEEAAEQSDYLGHIAGDKEAIEKAGNLDYLATRIHNVLKGNLTYKQTIVK